MGEEHFYIPLFTLILTLILNRPPAQHPLPSPLPLFPPPFLPSAWAAQASTSPPTRLESISDSRLPGTSSRARLSWSSSSNTVALSPPGISHPPPPASLPHQSTAQRSSWPATLSLRCCPASPASRLASSWHQSAALHLVQTTAM